MAKILIKSGKVWDGESFSYTDILADNGIVAQIKKGIDVNADYIYDAQGMIVSPGLVDIHTHMKGISSDEFGIDACMSCIPFGVTAAADAGGGKGNKEILDSFAVKNLVFPFAEFKDNKACFEETEKLLTLYGQKAIGIKVYFDTTISDVRDIKPLKEVISFAEKNNLKVMVHSSNPPVTMTELLAELRSGDILTHAYHGGNSSVSEDNFKCIHDAKERGVIIDVGFAGHVHTDFKILCSAIKSGAEPDTISTDITKWSAYKRGGRYGMTMCMSICRHLGMEENEVFHCVTSSPAKALGMEHFWGYLRVGRCADIAIFDYSDESFDLMDKAGNHIASEKGYRCVLTVADGEIIYKI